jgi:hypothetical protein
MNNWLIIPTERLPELEELNARFSDRTCTAHQTADDVLVTGADKLSDAYWVEYADFLGSLEEFVGVPEFVQPEAEG